MTLNHLNLAVTDVPRTQAFLEKYFGLQSLTKPSPVIAIMRDNAGMMLTISNFSRTTDVSYPNDFHIGFYQESEAAVNALHERFTADGYILDPPRRMHNAWAFYVLVPGGFLAEVMHYQSVA